MGKIQCETPSIDVALKNFEKFIEKEFKDLDYESAKRLTWKNFREYEEKAPMLTLRQRLEVYRKVLRKKKFVKKEKTKIAKLKNCLEEKDKKLRPEEIATMVVLAMIPGRMPIQVLKLFLNAFFLERNKEKLINKYVECQNQ